jgi:oligopeptide/dipeptide ABC transporter ATP-binding protein
VTADTILDVDSLTLDVRTRKGVIRPVDNVSFSLTRGEALALVGESGCGKTMTLRSILRLLPREATIVGGHVYFDGVDITQLPPREFRLAVRGQIGVVFQEPLSALNPVIRVGNQIAEGPRRTLGLSKSEARDMAIGLMRQVGIPDPERRARAFPHELSGGMRQRVLIAIALASKPKIILCDEPTTALDVTIQDQILKLLARLRAESSLSLLLVTHDLAVVAETCQNVAVMYAGRIVETGSVDAVLTSPRHGYTLQLLRSVPDVDRQRSVEAIAGSPPDLLALPEGCRFRPRCVFATPECGVGSFPLRSVTSGRQSACIHHEACARSSAERPVVG